MSSLLKKVKLKKYFFNKYFLLFKKLLKIKPKYFTNKKNKKSKSIKQSFFLHLNFNEKFQPSVDILSIAVINKYFEKLNNYFNKKLIQSHQKILLTFYNSKINNIKDLFLNIYSKFFTSLQEVRKLLSFQPHVTGKTKLKKKFKKNQLNKFEVNKIKIFLLGIAKKKSTFFNLQNLKEHKLELAKIFSKIFKNKTLLRQSEHILFLRFFETKLFRKKQFLFFKLNSLEFLKTWLVKYRLFLKNKNLSFEELQQKKKKEYATNYRLLKHKFKNSLTKFTEYKKKQDLAKKKRHKLYFISYAAILFKFRFLKTNKKKFLSRNFFVHKLNYNFANTYKHYLKQYKFKFTKVKNRFYFLLNKFKRQKSLKSLKLKLFFKSKRVFKFFLNSINFVNDKIPLMKKIDKLNALVIQLNEKFRKFNLFKIKQNLSIIKKLPFFTKLKSIKNNLSSFNISTNKNYFTKSRFLQYINKNNLFHSMHLTKPDEETFKLSSDIKRATHFRSLLNKENAFYEIFYKQQNPLRLLTTITGHNIYLTLFISSPYKILWKASSGMLGLKHFRRAKKHQMTFKDLLIRCQLYMARHRLLLRRPLHLLLRHLNYTGTRNFLSFFVKQRKNNEIFENYQNLNFYKFYKNAPQLCNNYAFQFLSMIWSRMRHTLRQKRNFAFYTLVNKQRQKFQALRNVTRVPNFFIDIKMEPTTNLFFKKNPFKIRKTI